MSRDTRRFTPSSIPFAYPTRRKSGIEDREPVAFNQASGRVTRMLTRRDITEERKRNEALQLAKSFFDTTSEGIFALDARFHFLTANRAFSRTDRLQPE